jgi:hypothetical protein
MATLTCAALANTDPTNGGRMTSTYIRHDKMVKSLEKLFQTRLHDLPTMITVVKITKAKTDEAKRRLVRAAIFATNEVHRRLQLATSHTTYPVPYSYPPYCPEPPKKEPKGRSWLEPILPTNWKDYIPFINKPTPTTATLLNKKPTKEISL